MATVVLPEPSRALYPFRSRYVTLSDGKQMHYVDEGAPDGEVLVFVHGFPTWSFVYRALLVYYAARGYRCIAMDHIGFGLSDKPTGARYHTLRRHIHNLQELIATLKLPAVTLIMEDWGGPFGLGYTVRRCPTVRRLVIMNTWVFQDTYPPRLEQLVRLVTLPGVGELLFRTLNLAPNLILQRVTTRRLSPAVLGGYRAPFRENRSRTALVQFPRLISTGPDHPSAPALREIERGLAELEHIPTLLLWGARNPIFGPDIARHWKRHMLTARGPHVIEHAGHLLAEDAPEEMIAYLDDFLAETDARPADLPPL